MLHHGLHATLRTRVQPTQRRDGTKRTGKFLAASKLNNFDDLIEDLSEDLLVMGHTHEWLLKTVKRKNKKD